MAEAALLKEEYQRGHLDGRGAARDEMERRETAMKLAIGANVPGKPSREQAEAIVEMAAIIESFLKG